MPLREQVPPVVVSANHAFFPPGRARWRVAGAIAATVVVAGCASLSQDAPRQTAALDAEAYGWLDRVTWGVNATAARDLQSLGRERFLERELHPVATPLPVAVEATLTSLRTEPLDRTVMRIEAERKAARALPDDEARTAALKAYQTELTRLARESAERSLLRDVYSTNQLEAQMTWFWLNHFSVCQCKRDLRAMVGDYEERAIRPHALGKFRDLLVATMRHPAMLRYLDNEQNAVGRINENYARELMELHTLGVEGGYTQKDVQELARVLTGLGINATDRTPKLRPALANQYFRDGLTEFNPARHDYGDKELLGHTVHGDGLAEIDAVATMLARHPATARFVSRKLALYFVSDDPSPALVERMATAFGKSDGDIAVTLSVMFHTPEFAASLHTKFKDPTRYVVSAVRLAYDDRPLDDPIALVRWVARTGEPLYGRVTPDGYPLTQSAWTSPGQLVARFEVARLIGTRTKSRIASDAATASTPAASNAGSFVEVAELTPLDPATRESLAQAKSAQEFNALLLSSPEFMQY